MLHLILTHHVTAPSPPISPQTREDTKEIRVVCSLTSRSALAPAIGHRHTHPQSEARTPPGPGTVRRADSWHILPSPSTRSQKAPSLVFLTLPTCLASDLDEGNFFSPFQELTYRYRPPLFQEPQQGALCYNLRSGTPHPIPGIQLLFSSSEQPQ